MIPKIIHYCWFGGNPLPELAKKCIDSWEKYCPDYEIIEWNESNFDVNCCDYVREAYEAKKWAFVTDYVRLKVLYEYGGIYLDTDVEIIKNIDKFLEDDIFMALEKPDYYIATGLGFGSTKGSKVLFDLMLFYENINFVNDTDILYNTTCPIITTDYFEKRGFIRKDRNQYICGTHIYNSEYFCPKEPNADFLYVTNNTVAIHHFSGSWMSDEEKYIQKIYQKLLKKFSLKLAHRLSLVIGFTRYRGILKMPKAMLDYKLNNMRNK